VRRRVAETRNLKLAQKLLGQSNLSAKADIYADASAEAERDAAVAVERAIYGDLFPIVPKMGTGTAKRPRCKEGNQQWLYS
jgi:hypothetical protein